jgi:hypothetical protein
VMLAQYDRSRGRTDSTDAVLKRMASLGRTKPLLLSTEPIKVPGRGVGDNALFGNRKTHSEFMLPTQGFNVPTSNILKMMPDNFENRWIDVGFWVNPNGNVTDIEVLRSKGDRNWAPWVTDSIKTRIYAPMKPDDKNPDIFGHYIVERYTLTARYMEEVTGTRIATRTAQPRIERLDLTPDMIEAPKGR